MPNSIKILAVLAAFAIFLTACNEGSFIDDNSAPDPDVSGNHESTVFVKAVRPEIVEVEDPPEYYVVDPMAMSATVAVTDND